MDNNGPASEPIPGQNNVSAKAVEETKNLLKNFERQNEKRFEFERIIGEGAFGFTLKMKTKDSIALQSVPRPIRRFVMKRALNQQAQQNVTNEVNVLQQLQGAMHICQPFYINPDQADNKLQYLNGPSLLIEWIENGIIYDFVDRLADWGQPLPNRMLWRFFLCLCRSLVAMAWPPGRDIKAPLEIEVLPNPNEKGERPAKSLLIHGDLNNRNVMIGDFEDLEHEKIPMLKAIDFGNSRTLNPVQNQSPDVAVRVNMFDIGKIMLSLIGGTDRGGSTNMQITYRGEKKTIRSYAADLDGLNKKYGSPSKIVAFHQEKLDNLDPEIRDLVALCLAAAPSQRPELEYLVQEVERNVETKLQNDYVGKKYHGNESDDALIRITRELILDANMDPLELQPLLGALPRLPPLPPPLLPPPPPVRKEM
ncbi:kinase-like domain-containing protein [Xylariaceae sp. FL0662B]|nr:kinase-like domain-containing protein [Xylariaceae sp. FL0662B]